MSKSFGMLTCFDSDRQFVGSVGQDVVYSAINDQLKRHTEVLNESMSVFVDRVTDLHKLRYLAPTGGYMQVVGRQAAAGAVKRTGHWDVALPLYGIEDRLATDRVDYGYLTAGQLEAQIKSIMNHNKNSVRRDLLSAIFIDNARVFADPIYGNLTIEPLANGDATVYPAVIGAAAGATDNHYLAMAALNAANFTIALAELTEHFGVHQGGENVVVFCNPTDAATIVGLGGFLAYIDRFSIPSDAATWTQKVTPAAPGICVGRYQGAWIQSWDYIPANYLVFIHLDAPAPLYMRKDEADTGLSAGLQLVAANDEYPITNSFYSHRYGFGCANRLNGVVWNLAANYSVPALYNWLPYASP